VIIEFLSWVKKLKGKKALSFVTMVFPWKSWGGTRAVKKMNGELESSGATVLQGEILRYFFGFNKQKLGETLERIYKAVAG
jgi:hypothetical protein